MDAEKSRDLAVASPSNGEIGSLLHRISDDVKTIARGEVELVRDELQRHAKMVAVDAAVVLLGALVALIGFALLCVVVVVALAPVIPPLWLRLLIMAVVYLVAGGAIAGAFGKRLKHDAAPDLTVPKVEAKLTKQNIKDGLSH